MFCVNCGNELKENYKFCYNCGSPVNTVIKYIKKEPALPLNWYNFYFHFRLPLAIIFDLLLLISFFSYEDSIWYGYPYYVFLIGLLFFALEFFTFLFFKYKIGYILNNILLWCNVVYMCLYMFTEIFDIYMLIFNLIFMTLIWWLPNFIYFSKRKYMFNKKI